MSLLPHSDGRSSDTPADEDPIYICLYEPKYADYESSQTTEVPHADTKMGIIVPNDVQLVCTDCQTINETMKQLKHHWSRCDISADSSTVAQQTFAQNESGMFICPFEKQKNEKACHFVEDKDCGRAFKSVTSLRRHIKVHTREEREFKCDKENCGKIFQRYSNLAQHKRTHATGTFKCDVKNCGEIFDNHYKLKRHKKTHSVEFYRKTPNQSHKGESSRHLNQEKDVQNVLRGAKNDK